MSYQEMTSTMRHPAISHSRPAPSPDEPGARIGLRVNLLTTLPGELKLESLPDHRVKVHVGEPVRGACQHGHFLYTRGDIDIFPAGLSDAWREEDPGTALLLQFSPSLLRHAAEDMGLDAARAGLELRCQLRDPQIEHMAWALDAERRAGYPGGLLYAESMGMALAVRLLRGHAAVARPSFGLSGAQLRRVTEYIEGHLDQDLSVARLAVVAGVSASHLKILFRRSTGVPVHQYVVQRRVERARTLLTRGKLPASQVALEAGFAHQSHMARWMRRMLGVTPAAVARSSRRP